MNRNIVIVFHFLVRVLFHLHLGLFSFSIFLCCLNTWLPKPVSEGSHFDRVRSAPHQQQSILWRDAYANSSFLFLLTLEIVYIDVNVFKHVPPPSVASLRAVIVVSLGFIFFTTSHYKFNLPSLMGITPFLKSHQPTSNCCPFFFCLGRMFFPSARRPATEEAAEFRTKRSQSFAYC
ncbi:hypothetical protein AAHE18_13G173800 [Arachis hypogaea]